MKLESNNLSPQTLPRTTSSTVQAALDTLWQTPSNQHHFQIGENDSYMTSDDWDIGTPVGSSLCGKLVGYPGQLFGCFVSW